METSLQLHRSCHKSISFKFHCDRGAFRTANDSLTYRTHLHSSHIQIVMVLDEANRNGTIFLCTQSENGWFEFWTRMYTYNFSSTPVTSLRSSSNQIFVIADIALIGRRRRRKKTRSDDFVSSSDLFDILFRRNKWMLCCFDAIIDCFAVNEFTWPERLAISSSDHLQSLSVDKCLIFVFFVSQCREPAADNFVESKCCWNHAIEMQ